MPKISIKSIKHKISESRKKKKDKQGGRIHLIIGASRLGAHIALRHAKRGLYVIIVDKNASEVDRLGGSFTGSFVHGDGTKLSTLINANIKSACEVVITTDDDDTNIFIANLVYAKFNKTNIVLRIDDETKHDLVLCPTANIINPYVDSFAQYISIYHQNDEGGKK